MLILYVLAIFLSAALVFLVEPMAAKLVLPLLGGTPAVWTTCVLFFQVLLLAGYVYGHLLDRYLKPRVQLLVHGLVMLAGAASLPLGLPENLRDPSGVAGSLPTEIALASWLLAVLGMAVGAPFFVASTTGPLLQRWFSRTGHARARDPYFMYAASNAGSLLGLAAYPLGFEPFMGVRMQGVAWAVGYGVFVAMALACGIAGLRGAQRDGEPVYSGAVVSPARPTERLSRGRVLRWLVLAAVPSSLMLGVTQQVATDVASVPLLWVIPLGLYLVTFILAYWPGLRASPRVLGNVLAVLAPWVVCTMILGWVTPMSGLLAGHFAAFFVAALMCHRLLADARPGPEHLTAYYVVIAAGGAVGGAFNSLLAPSLFNDVYEYPIALAAALMLRPAGAVAGVAAGGIGHRWARLRRAARLLAIPAGVAVVIALAGAFLGNPGWQKQAGAPLVETLRPWLRTAAPLAIAIAAFRRPPQFAVCFAIFAGSVYMFGGSGTGRLMYKERSFFGVHRVVEQYGGEWHTLLHGTTTHGVQLFIDEQSRLMPTSYYHPRGPVGQLYDALADDPRLTSVAVIGLGAGSMAAYAQPHDRYTFYEIDKAVVGIATGRSTPQPYFTFLKDARGDVKVVLADGRLGIASRARDGEYGLIVLDAFSSDAIPVHLLTREAFGLYFTKLVPDGLLAVHVSNRYFALAPPITRVAEDLGLVALWKREPAPAATDAVAQRQGKSASEWMVIGRTLESVAPLLKDRAGGWHRLETRGEAPLWTDDFSNVLEVLR